MKLDKTHLDLLDLIKKLADASEIEHRKFFKDRDRIESKALADLLIASASALNQMMRLTTELHRRTQEAESKTILTGEIDKLKHQLAYEKPQRQFAFRRMIHAQNELKIIYDEFRKAIPDGCDDYGYHSVMDSAQEPNVLTEPGKVYANRFKSKKGGVVSVHVASLAKPIVEELLRLRMKEKIGVLNPLNKLNKIIRHVFK
jgi:hypothetical protein